MTTPSSGVTNGDVDWLFRGKLKKASKNATDPDPDATKTPKAPVIPLPNDPQPSTPQAPPETPKEPAPKAPLSAPESAPVSSRSRLASLLALLRRSAELDLRRSSSDLQRKSSFGTLNGETKKLLFSSISSKFGKKKAQEIPSTPPPAVPVATPAVPADDLPEARKRFGLLRGKVVARMAGSRTVQPPGPTERVILNKNPNRVAVPIEQLHNLRMKRVTFDLTNVAYDPPQQIPPRHPKPGNVLIPEELVAEPPRVLVGIANSEKKVVEPTKEVDKEKYAMALENQRKALEEARKHAQEAHLLAMRIATEVSGYKLSKTGHMAPEKEDEAEIFHEGGVDIDKPMHAHEHHFGDEAQNEEDKFEGGDVPLDMLYTRCCHLREILPIPATLKQLKGKSKPLHVLKFLNPKPTLIDVLLFLDFVAIAPVITVIFDNVTLSNEMVKIVLALLAHNTMLEKLLLKNLMIDEEAWKYLCKFLLKNRLLLKLDLSQTKYRSDLLPQYYRFNMDWKLFVSVLKARGGILELILTGVDLRLEDFRILIEDGILLSTKRLGLALSNILAEKCAILLKWITQPRSLCEGIDFGFNDLSKGQLLRLRISNPDLRLLFVSLNLTNLRDVHEMLGFLRSLAELPSLSYLDLSGLPELIPQLVPYLKRYLPKCPSLKRIHFDYNNIAPKSLAAILDILGSCKKLIHVSLIGNNVSGVSASLYSCIKGSRSIFNLDVDYDQLPEQIGLRIAVVLMRNMEINLHGEAATTASDDLEDELIFDGSLIAESAEAFLKIKNEEGEDYSSKILKRSLLNKTKVIRQEIHTTIDALFEKRNNGELSIEGKERLLRFCLLDSALEKIVHLFDENNTPHRNLTRSDTGLSFVSAVDIPDDESMHDISKDLINTQETLSAELNTVQSSEIQYLNPQMPVAGPLEAPHQLAIEKSTDGREVSVDTATGRPILFRNVSQTSVNAKRQEEEEGELHRWGFFVQQHRQLFPDENVGVPVKKVAPKAEETPSSITPKLLSLISGEQLRKAVMKAKGIDSISELIDKVEHNDSELDKIYKVPEGGEPGLEKVVEKVTPVESKGNEDESAYDDLESVDSAVNDLTVEDEEKAVDETYDKLLNDVIRVRSNKDL